MLRSTRRPLLTGLALLLAAPALPALAQELPRVQWNLSTWGNPRPFTLGAVTVAERVAAATEGRFTIQVHHGEALSASRENLDGIELGAFEMATMCASYHPGKTPLLTVLDLPMLPVPDLATKIAVHEAVLAHPAITAELGRWNAMPFMSAVTQTSEFMGKGEPPLTLDDWSGASVRALGGMGRAMTAIGAVPTTMPAPEVYTALERGTVEAAAFPFTTAHVSFGTAEVADWYTANMAVGSTGCQVVMATRAFDALPDAYKAALMDAKAPAYAAMATQYAIQDARNLAAFEAEGLTAVTYDAATLEAFEQAAAQPVWDAWVQEGEADGRPSQELLDLVLRVAGG